MKIKLLIITILLLSNYCIFSKSKGAVFNATPSFVLQKQIFSTNYNKAKQLFDKQEYTSSLKLALNLINNNIEFKEEEVILINHLIANIFFATRNNTNAINYYNKTLYYLKEYSSNQNEFTEKKGFDFKKNVIKAEVLLNLGTSYYRLNNVDNLKKAKDSAIYFYKEVDKIYSIDNRLVHLKSKAYTNLSAIYINETLYDKAKYFAEKAIGIHRELNNKVNEAAALGNLSSIYLSENKYEAAKKNYFKALDLIKNFQSNKALLVKEKLYINLAYNLYKLKDYKAFNYQELSYNIKDSLRDDEFRGIIAEINEKYNFDVKKKLLLKEEENKRLKDQRTFWIIGISGFVIILSLSFWVNYYKLRQKNLGLKLSQSQLVQHQHLEKIRSESQVRILNATIDGKESERKQIAETLHDSVSALLSSANLHLQAARSQMKGGIPVEIDKSQQIITEASHKIRDLSHTLVSSVLLKFGLKFAINDMADKFSNSKIEIKTDIADLRRYHQNLEIKVHNITQEFVNNLLKHSKAKKAIIKLEEVKGKLSLTITDDGVGFDKTKVANKDGLGLNQIEARIQMMQGEFYIDSSKNKGTVIKVVLPILADKEISLV